MTITQDKKGNPQTASKPIVRRLLLTPDDTVEAATAIAALNTPPEPVSDVVETIRHEPVEIAAAPDATTAAGAADTTTPPV